LSDAKPAVQQRNPDIAFLSGEMTQGDLGDRVGVTRQTIAAIEQGKYSPSLEVAFRIARVFDKPLEAVFTWTEVSG
jgi:putative transcriptional regulator